MSETADAREGQLDQAEFKKKMLSQLQTTGVVGQVKSQLRAQLLSQLQKGQIVQLGPPPGDKPGLKRHALNSMIADYFGAVQYNYSLSVFKEESGVESRPLLTEDEILDVLKVDRDTSFYQSYMKSKAHGGKDSCFIMNILSAISEAAAAKGKETFTQTIGGDRYQMEMRMMQLENEYQAKLREARLAPGAGLEERLALYRQEIEEQAAAEVARQVERIREMEVAAARLDEASKARRALEAERLELDRLHSERLAKLRQREEEMMDKLRRQQRDVENVAYEYRQRILREEERMRNHKAELQQQADGREEQLKQLERSLELRERAVAAREAAAEKKLADATEAAAEAAVAAREDAEREYMELKNNLAHQRMQLEMDRSRLMELRSEATADIAAARAKEERLRALETARAEAEARAAAHAADAEVCRLQAEKLAFELNQAREELSRRLVQAAEGADAMLQNAAGAMNMLNAEAVASRAAGSQIRDALAQLERAREEAATASSSVAELQQERAALQGALAASSAEAEALRTQLGRVEALMDEAVAARGAALSSVEEVQFRMFQQERELSELRGALSRAKEELMALRMQAAVRRPPSRGAVSPSRRSVTISPPRRAPQGAASAAISALSLGVAFGGGGGAGGGGPGWHYQQSTGGSLAGGTPALSNVEFPIAAAPRDPTVERLERLRRQEDIVAGQEDTFRKRISVLQEMRSRSMAMLRQGAGADGFGGSPVRFAPGQQPPAPPPAQQQPYVPFQSSYEQDSSPPPYMTYVMHSSPMQQFQESKQIPSPPMMAGGQEGTDQADQEQQMLYAYQQQKHQQHRQEQQRQQLHRQQQQQQRVQEQQQRLLQEQQQQQQHQQQQQQQQQGRLEQPLEGSRSLSRNSRAAPYDAANAPHAQRSLFDGGRYGSVSGAAGAGDEQPTSDGSTERSQQQAPVPHGMAYALGRLALEPDGRPASDPSWTSSRSQQQRQQGAPSGPGIALPPSPPREVSYSVRGDDVQIAAGFVGANPGYKNAALAALEPPQEEPLPPPAAPPPPPEQRPAFALGMGAGSAYTVGRGQGEEEEQEVAAPPPPPPAPAPVVLPPPGLILTSNFRPPTAPAADAPPAAFDPPPPPPAAQDAPPQPAKITIPGLVMVSGFTPRVSTNGAAAAGQPPPPAPAAAQAQARAEEEVQAPPPPQDVENVLQAKMRMLQEQRERAIAAQQYQPPPPPPVQRLYSRISVSSRASMPSVSSPGGSYGVASPGGGGAGPLPRAEDSTSELIAGEAYDTVPPELSTVQRRLGGGRRTSHEGGGGSVSRQSSVNRRDLARGTSFVRSEASGLSVEVPGLAGQSMRALSVGMTLDDIPSSLEGYELPGLHDDDEGLEAGGDDERYGGFAAEMSAGSVF